MLGDPPWRRAKESFSGALELSPVRLIGGFVCVDTHLGCAACHFCLNRRYPAQRRVLELRIHRDWADAGLPPEEVAALVAALPAVTRARVPIRFGHLSDLAFMVEGARALLAALPPGRPAMLLTRFPPSARAASLVASHPNALLHLSVTPPVQGVLQSAVDPQRVLRAAAAVPPERLFVMLGPLAEGSQDEAARLLEAVPRGAAVGFKPLAAEGVPFETPAVPLGRTGLEALSARARELGLSVPPMAGCRLRENLGLPFFRHREIEAETPGACAGCPNRPVCGGGTPPSDESIRAETAVLGLRPPAIHREQRGLGLEVEEPVARADEVYLSERLGLPVYLSGIGRGTGFRVVEISDAVLRRWDRAGFYPAHRLTGAAARMAALIGVRSDEL